MFAGVLVGVRPGPPGPTLGARSAFRLAGVLGGVGARGVSGALGRRSRRVGERLNDSTDRRRAAVSES